MAAVFLDIETAYDTTRRSGLLYKLSKLVFWVSLIKLLGPFFRNENSVSVEGEMSTPRYMQAGVLQGSLLSPHYTACTNINDMPQTVGVNLALFTEDTCLYAT
jgi:hypothetical protein